MLLGLSALRLVDDFDTLSNRARPSLRRPLASVTSKAMLSLLFVLGLLVGIVGAVIAMAGVVIVVVTAAAWLNALVVFLRARINQPQPANRATALTTPHG